MSRSLALSFLALALGSNQAVAATGRIIDSTSQKPIAGATVLGIWYYTPFSVPLPIEGTHYPAGTRCGAVALAVTGSDGGYDFGAAFSLKQHLHETHVWVVANDYYNDWLGPNPGDQHDFAKLLAPLQWDPARSQKDHLSSRLTPLGNASVDAKLLALRSTGGGGQCIESDDRDKIAAFNEAVSRALRDTICSARENHEAPRTDVYRAAFPAIAEDRSIRSLLPRRERAPVPQQLVDAACTAGGAPNRDRHVDRSAVIDGIRVPNRP